VGWGVGWGGVGWGGVGGVGLGWGGLGWVGWGSSSVKQRDAGQRTHSPAPAACPGAAAAFEASSAASTCRCSSLSPRRRPACCARAAGCRRRGGGEVRPAGAPAARQGRPVAVAGRHARRQAGRAGGGNAQRPYLLPGRRQLLLPAWPSLPGAWAGSSRLLHAPGRAVLLVVLLALLHDAAPLLPLRPEACQNSSLRGKVRASCRRRLPVHHAPPRPTSPTASQVLHQGARRVGQVGMAQHSLHGAAKAGVEAWASLAAGVAPAGVAQRVDGRPAGREPLQGGAEVARVAQVSHA
jgi:hypothetical protein